MSVAQTISSGLILSAGAAIYLLFWFSSECSVEPLPLVFSAYSWGPHYWRPATKLFGTGLRSILRPSLRHPNRTPRSDVSGFRCQISIFGCRLMSAKCRCPLDPRPSSLGTHLPQRRKARQERVIKTNSLRSWRPFDGVYPELSRRAQDMLGAINPLRLLNQNPIDSLAALR